jgi:hypothetical protein
VGSHYFRLSSTDDGSTELRHGEDFRGLAVPVLLPLLRTELTSFHERINAGLKQRAESLASA